MERYTALWRQWSDRFASRSLRERAIIAGGLVVVVVVLFDALFLQPLAQQQRRLAGQVAEARAAIKASEQMLATGRDNDPDEVKRRYRDELRKQIADIDGRLQGLQKQLVPPDQVVSLLEGVLSRERGLALVSLRKLPVQRFETTAGAAGTAKTGGKDAAAERGIFQHSFEIEVEGSYAELHAYLVRLEKLPWQLFWGKVALDATGHPRLKLTLTVHTLSMDRVWLVV